MELIIFVDIWQGACLAVAGTALLFFMRGFDLWIEASKAGASLASIFGHEAWLQPSGFLLVPLALNAFLLCPIVIRRALSARRKGLAPGSVVLASVLMGASLAYLDAVAVRWRG